MPNLLITEVSSMAVEASQGTVHWRSSTEDDVRTEIVTSFLAERTHPTRNTWLNSNTVT